jgi:TrmH family RNA methyltransferase
MIESVHNEIIKKTLLLKNKKDRDELGLFLVEGIKQVLEIKSDWVVKEVFVDADFSDDFLGGAFGASQLVKVSKKVLEKLSSVKAPQGVVAVVEKKKFDIGKIFQNEGYFLLLENISDPGNMGTIIRSADAFGARAVFVSKESVDIYSDKVLRSTMGSIFNLPVIDQIEIESFLLNAAKEKIKIFATSLNAKKYLKAIKLPKKSLILIGNESKGLSSKAINLSADLFKIPIQGKAQSLNAAIATSIILYELSSSEGSSLRT